MKFYIGKTALAIFWGCIKRYVAAVMATKADKAETLAGYGIKDAYKKTDVDKLIEDAAQSGDADNGFAGIIDVQIAAHYDPDTGKQIVDSISNIDEVKASGLYRLCTGNADSIMNVESLTENYIVQYVMIGGFMGINSWKFAIRYFTDGAWTAWQPYDILSKKQDYLACGEPITIRVGPTQLYLTEPRLQKLKTLLEA